MKTVAVALVCASFAICAARQSDTFDTSAGPVKITPIQHASFMIEAGGKLIQVDPVGPELYEDIPRADLILITDIHGDHMAPPTIADWKSTRLNSSHIPLSRMPSSA